MVRKSVTAGLFVLMAWIPLSASGNEAKSPKHHKKVVVDLGKQRAYALEDGRVVFSGRISSGRRGRETPTGNFRILQKERLHRSNLWPKPKGGAKMPYMMRLTWDGVAMHLGHVPNHPASHGCVRLRNGFAQKLYRWAPVGTPVEIDGGYYTYVGGSGVETLGYGGSAKLSTDSDGYEIIETY